jgi:hypothetical protein
VVDASVHVPPPLLEPLLDPLPDPLLEAPEELPEELEEWLPEDPPLDTPEELPLDPLPDPPDPEPPPSPVTVVAVDPPQAASVKGMRAALRRAAETIELLMMPPPGNLRPAMAVPGRDRHAPRFARVEGRPTRRPVCRFVPRSSEASQPPADRGEGGWSPPDEHMAIKVTPT